MVFYIELYVNITMVLREESSFSAGLFDACQKGLHLPGKVVDVLSQGNRKYIII